MDMVLVFSRMKHAADRIARNLEQKGIKHGHAAFNRSQNQRLRALKDFKSGAVRVLVATDIAARGIDVDGISHVVNYDFPMHSEDYVHRIGRTGRAHAVGDAISFVTPEDHGELRALERFIGRGIVRKKAEGFNYSQAAPAFNPAEKKGVFRAGKTRIAPACGAIATFPPAFALTASRRSIAAAATGPFALAALTGKRILLPTAARRAYAVLAWQFSANATSSPS